MKTKKFIFVLFMFWGTYANAQYIIAGQHSVNDYYYKFTPDSIVINIPAYSNLHPHYYSLDVNNDGINDFQFVLLPPGTALGANLDYCTIRGLNNNNVALGNYDSCFNYGNGYRNRYGMAYTFHYQDTINSNANWDSLVYLSYYAQGGLPDSQYYDCGSPDWPDTAYIGLRVKKGTTYEYGWIKIVGIIFNPVDYTTLTMGSFACENNATGIKQLTTTTNGEQVSVYPNPANNRLMLISGSARIILISIFDLQGKEMIKTKEKEIDISNLQEGFYFARVKTSEGIFTKKIIIQR